MSEFATKVDPSAYAGLSPTEQINDDSLRLLDSLAQELAQRERDLDDAKSAYTKAIAALEDIQNKRLPDFMQKYNRLRHDFVDAVTGEKRVIVFDSDWSVKMPTIKIGNQYRTDQEKARVIYEWLREINQGGVIKKTYEVNAGLVSDDVVLAIDQMIHEKYPSLETGVAEKVEPQTLKSLVKRLLGAGGAVHEFLRVEPVKRAVFK